MSTDLQALSTFLATRGLPDGVDAPTFVAQVVEQLVKDFQLDAARVARASISFVELLADDIAEGLNGIGADDIFAAFYRLDLGEDLVRKILHDNDRPEAARQLAVKSVERAALKVWTRWHYR